MTAPDVREWYPLDLTDPGASQHDAVRKFRVAHPAVTFARLTLLGEGGWLCIEGWAASPDDQGPLPTDADIPIGFGR
jgi:hypothetical protein